jgi:sugar phosphate permease
MRKKSLRALLFADVPRLPFYYGWIIVGVAILAQFISGFGHPYVASVFIDHIKQELGWSLTVISGMYTAGSLIAAPLLLFVGRLLDRFGSRLILAVICLLMGVVTILMSRISHPTHLLAGFAIVRLLGDSSLNLVSIALVSLWFMRLRGRATAVASLGLATSHSMLPLLAQLLIDRYGWRDAWVGFGFIIWTILLIPTLLLIRNSPESVGLLPDGTPGRADKPKKRAPGPKFREINFTLPQALRTRTLWLLLVSSISLPLIITGLLFHHIPLMQTRGLSSQLAAASLLLWGPSMILGNFTGGFLVERIESRFLLAGVQIVLILALLLNLLIAAPWQMFAYVALAGSSVGVYMTCYAVTWSNYYGRLHLGAIRGVASMNTLLFSALGALPFGMIFDITGSYDMAILVLLGVPVVSGIAGLLSLPPRPPAGVQPVTS